MKVKNSILILRLYNDTEKTLKYVMGKELKKENQEQTEDEVDLMPQEHKRALEGAFKSFTIPGLSNGYFNG